MNKQQPMTVIRKGMIAASIWKREGSKGEYYEYTLARSFKRGSGEGFKYSGSFGVRDADALRDCIAGAESWIRHHRMADDETRPRAVVAHMTAEERENDVEWLGRSREPV